MRRALVFASLVVVLAAPPALAQAGTPFSRLIERLSEPDGYFHSDNLVSNETSFLHVLGAIRDLRLEGGAYIGVGPEQSFSYIAELEPEIAYLIDIRRDNLLLHLLLKAMFETAGNRLEYLCLLYGRPAPADLALWTELPLESLIEYLDRHRSDSLLQDRNHRRLMERVEKYGYPLSVDDRRTIRRFHDQFARAGLDLQYTTRAGRIGRPMPTSRELYLATDLEGRQAGYLSSEDRWRRVRDLERRDLVIPVVGDLAGPTALRAIGRHLRETRRKVTVFYLSNVEQYLFRNQVFAGFVGNVRALPAAPNGILIRSVVGGGRWGGGTGWGPVTRQRAQTIRRFRQLTRQPDSVDYLTLTRDAIEIRLRQPADTVQR